MPFERSYGLRILLGRFRKVFDLKKKTPRIMAIEDDLQQSWSGRLDQLIFSGFCKGDFYSVQAAGDKRLAIGANWRSRIEGLGEKVRQSVE